ncbi:hypothetical protein GCK32_003221 [Trichostrongylus colubriformis]|uniref:Uncharacterized protein n=1 Tax=Trichostrongylus colubriformis TaxID=6319 RepID=A0AAN8GF24_TRICO
MVVPPSKKKKFYSEDELKVLQKTVRQALLSDDKSCEILLGKLVGFEKEVVDALVIILKTCNVFQFSPTSPVLRVVCQNFASIGATTAVERFHEFHNLILTHIDNKYTSNFVFLMEKLISFSHVLRHDKLRHELCNHLPNTIELLWQNKKHVEACRIAKLLVELMLVAKLYYDEENLPALWLQKIASAGMMECPYISALTILLDPQRSICGKGLIGLTDLLELPSNEIRDLCLRAQLFSLMSKINEASGCLAEVDTLWNSILKVLSQQLYEVLSRKDSHKSPVLNALASALQNLSSADQCSDSSFSTIAAPIRLVFEQGAEQKSSRKRKLGHDFETIASVLCNLPLENLSASLSKHYTVAVLLFAIASESTDLPLFSLALRALRSLTKQPEERLLLRQLLIMDGIFLDFWFSNEKEYSPTLCKDVIAFLCNVFEVESNGKICCDNTRDLCPALKYFEGEDAACWSWKQLMRFSILFASTRWEELLQSSDSSQNHVIQKIRSIYLVNMVSSITWKNEELLSSFAGRWSVLLTCWEAIPRGSRQPLMAKLLGSDLKIIGKFADRIIKKKLQLNKSIVEQALVFHLKYRGISDEAQPLENIIDWDVLFYLKKMGAPLDIVIPQLSVDKVVEMLQLCSTEDVLNEDALAIVGRMISLRLKERCNDVLGTMWLSGNDLHFIFSVNTAVPLTPPIWKCKSFCSWPAPNVSKSALLFFLFCGPFSHTLLSQRTLHDASSIHDVHHHVT